MKRGGSGLFVVLALAASCRSSRSPAPPANDTSLTEARRGFATHVFLPTQAGEPPPPVRHFDTVQYESPAGSLAAYVSVRPPDHARHPAIVWLAGGFSNSIGPSGYSPVENDQSAEVFREAGVVLMLPSRRGGNDNPGANEGLYGEVDDAIAAARYLARLDYVDPARIYLGGHSTGGTLALLVAESTDRFRAVFSFGPVPDIRSYDDVIPLGDDPREGRLRSPMNFMASIRTPTFVIEGEARGNAAGFPLLRRASGAAPVRFYTVPGATHFSVLWPASALLARKLLADDGPGPSIAITDAELAEACSTVARYEPARRAPTTDAGAALQSVRLLDPQPLYPQNIEMPALVAHIRTIGGLVDRSMAGSPAGFDLMVRFTLRSWDRGEFQVAAPPEAPEESLTWLDGALEAVDAPRTRRDALHVEAYFHVRGGG